MVSKEISTGMEICPSMRSRICSKTDENRCKEREPTKLINKLGSDWRFDRLSFIVTIILITTFYNNSFCNLCYTYPHSVFNVIEENLCLWRESIDYEGGRAMGSVNFQKHWNEGVE